MVVAEFVVVVVVVFVVSTAVDSDFVESPPPPSVSIFGTVGRASCSTFHGAVTAA